MDNNRFDPIEPAGAPEQPVQAPAVYPGQGYPAGSWPQANYGVTGYPAYAPQPVPGGEQQPGQFYVQPPAYAVPAYVPPVLTETPAQRERKAASRRINRLCIAVLMTIVVAFAVEIPMIGLAMLRGVDITADDVAYQLLVTAMAPISTALPFLVYLLVGHREKQGYIRVEPLGFVNGLLLVLAGLAVALLTNYPAFWVQEFFSGFGYEPISQFNEGEESWLLLALEVAGTGILVPVMEEFAFRGVLFSALRRFGAGFAIFTSALLFALLHMDASIVVFAFVCGLVFGYLYYRTENIWVGVAIHMLNNTLAVLGSYGEFLTGSEEGAYLLSDLLTYIPLALGGVALILLLIFKRPLLFSHKPPEEEPAIRLGPGRSLKAIACAPLFWVVLACSVGYTLSLFFPELRVF